MLPIKKYIPTLKYKIVKAKYIRVVTLWFKIGLVGKILNQIIFQNLCATYTECGGEAFGTVAGQFTNDFEVVQFCL